MASVVGGNRERPIADSRDVSGRTVDPGSSLGGQRRRDLAGGPVAASDASSDALVPPETREEPWE